jgi:hypothetical protein
MRLPAWRRKGKPCTGSWSFWKTLSTRFAISAGSGDREAYTWIIVLPGIDTRVSSLLEMAGEWRNGV